MTVFLSILCLALAVALWLRHRDAARSRALEQAAHARLEEAHRREVAALQIRGESALDAMNASVAILDSAGRIAFANVALRERFAPDEDIVGQTLMEALRLHQLGSLLDRVARPGGERHAAEEIELPRIGQPSASYHAAVSRLDAEDPGSRAAVVVLHDISPFKDIERVRADFVANVSHELRTPLSIIKAYAETLASGAGEAADYAKYAAIIEKHADRLTYLVDDLLTLSGLESGQLEIDRERFLFEPLAARVIADLAEKAAARGVTLRVEVPPGLKIDADGNRIEQVLTNLVENAIAYGREDGKVMVRAASLPHGGAVLSVSDDGPGIPLGERERVFERFFRLDRGRSRDSGGTGLGLAIVKHIAIAHGGRAWVEESPGGGATFRVSLSDQSIASEAAALGGMSPEASTQQTGYSRRAYPVPPGGFRL